MTMTPGGPSSPSAPPPPPPSPPESRPGVRRQTPAPTGGAALLSIVRWGTLFGGLTIISDLGTELLQRRMGAASTEPDSTIFFVQLVLSALFFSLAGRTVGREVGGVAFGAVAGLLAGILDGFVVGLAQDMSVGVATVQQSVLLTTLTENALLGFVLGGASAFFTIAGQRRVGPPGRR